MRALVLRQLLCVTTLTLLGSTLGGSASTTGGVEDPYAGSTGGTGTGGTTTDGTGTGAATAAAVELGSTRVAARVSAVLNVD